MTGQDDLLGKLVNGYQIEGVIGRGGMATVYRAVQMSMGRVVAMKVLPRQFVDDETYIQRFNREVQIVSTLEHRCIVPVYDYGETERQPYIVMRYMPHGSIETLLAENPVLLERTVEIIRQIAPALDYAHSKRVLHRDLKPSNILLDDGGGAFITDFGIARILGEGAGSTITTQGVVGTPAYMSPEQAQGLPLDARSDLYSLGVMVFEMLTGRRPFEGDTPYGVAVMQVTAPPPAPRSINPALSVAVESVIYRALSKRPDQRYASAVELAKALQQAADGKGTNADRTAIPQMQQPVPTVQTVMPQTHTPPPYSAPANQPPSRSNQSAWMPPVQQKRRHARPEREPNPLMSLMLGGAIGCGLLVVLIIVVAVVAVRVSGVLEAPPTLDAEGGVGVPGGGITLGADVDSEGDNAPAFVTEETAALPGDTAAADEMTMMAPATLALTPTPQPLQVTAIFVTPSATPGIQPPGVR